MAGPRVYVTRRIADKALQMIAEVADIKLWQDDLPPPREILLAESRSIEGLLSTVTDKVDATLFDNAPLLNVVSNIAVGYDNIDVSEATKRRIVVGNTPEVLTETTADLAFALLMAAARRVVEADKFTRAGRWRTWSPTAFLGYDVHHATLGIVGLGRIGTEIAKRARGFDMKVLYYSRTRKPDVEQRLGLRYVPYLNQLLSESDFVSLHVPLTGETKHMIGEAELAAMKPTAILVNTTRGPVVDQKALHRALKSQRICAAALDVTEVEPIPSEDPLLTLDNLVITPHIGSASVATRTKMAVMAAENLIAGLRGELPPNCVNPEALEGQ